MGHHVPSTKEKLDLKRVWYHYALYPRQQVKPSQVKSSK